MASSAGADSEAFQDNSFSSLPAEYQQVMSPRGAPADARTTSQVPNGVPATAFRRQADVDDTAYAQALGTADLRDVRPSGNVSSSDDVRQDVRAGEQIREAVTLVGEGERGDRPLLPHAAVSNDRTTTPMRAATATHVLVPSPLPTPTTQRTSDALPPTAGLSLAQQGAAAMRWFGCSGFHS